MKSIPSSLNLCLLLSLFLTLCLTTACDPAETEPAYITVQGFEDGATGEDQNDLAITEVWVFANNTFLGAYDMPARIPILLTGATELEFRAGIRQDGRTQVPDIYPFYRPIVRNVELVPGTTTDIGVLPVSYTAETNIIIDEKFEPGSPLEFTELLTGANGFALSTSNPYQGQASGRLVIDTLNPTVEIASSSTFRDLTNLMRGNVWVEVNYRSDVPVVFGIVGILPAAGFSRFYDPGFNPSTEWQKIYFNLTGVVGNSMLENYSFSIAASLAGSELATGTVLLDNLKVLYL